MVSNLTERSGDGVVGGCRACKRVIIPPLHGYQSALSKNLLISRTLLRNRG
jgi:hypothetical protein